MRKKKKNRFHDTTTILSFKRNQGSRQEAYSLTMDLLPVGNKISSVL